MGGRLRYVSEAFIPSGAAMPNQEMPEHFSDWNEQMVARHDPEAFHHHPQAVVRWVEGQRVGKALALLQAGPEHRVLDVGCGAGNVLSRIRARERHGLDLSKRMVARAQERLKTGATIVHGDAEALPYAAGEFDRVLCSSVLSHVLHPEHVLAECYRVLKPGGRLVVSVSHEAAIERGIRLTRALFLGRLLLGWHAKPEKESVYSSEYHLHRFDLKYLREAARSLPREARLRRAPFFYPVHYIVLYAKPEVSRGS